MSALILPNEARGFAVERGSGLIHARYPGHATGELHRTSPTGVRSMLLDRPLRLCALCYPPPPPARAARRPKAEPKPEPKAAAAEPESKAADDSDRAVAETMSRYRQEMNEEDWGGP